MYRDSTVSRDWATRLDCLGSAGNPARGCACHRRDAGRLYCKWSAARAVAATLAL